MSEDAKYPISSADDRTPGVHVFPGEDDQFYWHQVAKNGKITATGGESFTTAEHAWEGADAARRGFLGGLIEELEKAESARQAAGLRAANHRREMEDAERDEAEHSGAVQQLLERLTAPIPPEPADESLSPPPVEASR
ncbi:MAG TPA: hypothetical protein VGK41_05530 [Solirubrobacterales bacterium]